MGKVKFFNFPWQKFFFTGFGFHMRMDLHRFLNGPIMDVARYSRLSRAEKKTLQKLSPKETITAAKETLPIAEKFKTFLDKKFGTDNYTFVSIGRSPVMVGRTLEGMGVEAKYVPISGLHPRYNVDGELIDNTLGNMRLDKFIEYLKSIGLGAEAVQKNSKKVIFYDYTSSGDTLGEMRKFFRKRMGLPFFKCEFRSINDDLEAMCGFDKIKRMLKAIKALFSLMTNNTVFSRDYKEADEYIINYWTNSHSAHFSHIPQLNFWDANKVVEVMKNFKPDKPVLFFNFNILNLLEKAGLLVQK